MSLIHFHTKGLFKNYVAMGLEESFLKERIQWVDLNNDKLSEWILLLGPVVASIFICDLDRAMNSEIASLWIIINSGHHQCHSP